MEDPQTQVHPNPLILAQAKDLGMRALTKITNLSVPTQRYPSIRQNPNELYMQFIESLQDVTEKQIANCEARSQLILKAA